MCTGNLATQICQHRECSTEKALDTLAEMSYFLGTKSFADDVFCR